MHENGGNNGKMVTDGCVKNSTDTIGDHVISPYVIDQDGAGIGNSGWSRDGGIKHVTIH